MQSIHLEVVKPFSPQVQVFDSNKYPSPYTTLSITCCGCNSITNFSVTQDQLNRFNAGVLPKVAFPHLSDDDNAHILSYMCLNCFKNEPAWGNC